MFNRLRSISTDRHGNRLPMKQVALKLGMTASLVLICIWAASLLVVLNPLVFIAVGAAVGGAWYGSHFGFKLPWPTAPQSATEDADTPAPTAAPRARTASVSQQPPSRRPQLGGGRR